MKNIYLLTVALLFTLFGFSQNNLKSADDSSRISLLAYMPDQISKISAEAKQVLFTKMNLLSTKNGIGGGLANPRFIITANVIELTKDVSSTTPTIYSYNLQVTLYIGDGIDGTLFSSIPVNLKGNGYSETKAYLKALKDLDVNDPKFKDFITEGKTKIIEYYNSKCDFIIKDADALASTKGYDEAIFKLASVPDVCKDCYAKCLDKIGVIYKAKMENECQTYIAQATTLMAQENYYEAAEVLSPILPDLSCYPKAQALLKDINDHKCATAIGKARGAWASHDTITTSEALASIPSDSKCYPEAVALANEVKKYVKDTENRDFEFMKQQHKDEVSIRKATIKAARDIGVAYGNGPKATVVRYNIRGWW
jgi:hypothetical protein